MEEGREYNTCGRNYYVATISQALYIYPHLIPTKTLTNPIHNNVQGKCYNPFLTDEKTEEES